MFTSFLVLPIFTVILLSPWIYKVKGMYATVDIHLLSLDIYPTTQDPAELQSMLWLEHWLEPEKCWKPKATTLWSIGGAVCLMRERYLEILRAYLTPASDWPYAKPETWGCL